MAPAQVKGWRRGDAELDDPGQVDLDVVLVLHVAIVEALT
jgi:hypothetical protein